jgi:hypothetical protein
MHHQDMPESSYAQFRADQGLMKWRNFSDTGMFVMFHISIHPEPHISVQAHPHPEAPKVEQGAHSHTRPPVSVTPGIDFSALGESGQHSGLLAHLRLSHPGFIRVMLPGDASAYYIKRDAAKGLHQLYTRDPSTDAFKQTPKQVAPDGRGGWQADDGLKGGVKDSPEARALRLQNATASQLSARGEYQRAKRLVSSNKRDVIASQKKVSDLNIWIGQTERSIENKTRIVERHESTYTEADNDLTGAANQLEARREQLKQRPQDKVALSRLTTAQERYNKALEHRNSADSNLSSAKSALAQEQENLGLQRLDLAVAEHDLSVDEAVQTMVENDLAKAKVALGKAEEELKLAQA